MLKKNKSFLAFVIIAVIFLIWGIFLIPGDELFYALLGQYLILPAASFICSILCVKKGGVLGWLAPFIFAVITVALPVVALGATDIAFVVFAAVPAAAGFLIGALCALVSKKTEKGRM